LHLACSVAVSPADRFRAAIAPACIYLRIRGMRDLCLGHVRGMCGSYSGWTCWCARMRGNVRAFIRGSQSLHAVVQPRVGFSALSGRVGRFWLLNAGAASKPGVITIRWHSPASNRRRIFTRCEKLRFGCRLSRADSRPQLTEGGRTRHQLRTDSVLLANDMAWLRGTRSQLAWRLASVAELFQSGQPESARGCTATRGIF
jgi:hypothetical protein